MIPQIIHYCWFGRKPLPDLALKCIASWRKYLPEYEIKEWNEDSFDVNMIPYTAEAYKLKKYAFVSDYVRFYVIYYHGGLYFDTDVELIRPIDSIVNCGAFMGFEKGLAVNDFIINAGLGIGAEPGNNIYNEILNKYKRDHFTTWSGVFTETVVDKVSAILKTKEKQEIGEGIIRYNDIYIYPVDYFCPLNYYTNELEITDNTISIHHYHATWIKNDNTIIDKIRKRINFILVRLWSFIKFAPNNI